MAEEIVSRDTADILSAARATIRDLDIALERDRDGVSFLIMTRRPPPMTYDIKMFGWTGVDLLTLALALLKQGAHGIDRYLVDHPGDENAMRLLGLSSAAHRAARLLATPTATESKERLS